MNSLLCTRTFTFLFPNNTLPWHLAANLTDCDELDTAWTDCSFDDAAAAEIDAQLKADEEFSISFWFKVMTKTYCFSNFNQRQ